MKNVDMSTPVIVTGRALPGTKLAAMTFCQLVFRRAEMIYSYSKAVDANDAAGIRSAAAQVRHLNDRLLSLDGIARQSAAEALAQVSEVAA